MEDDWSGVTVVVTGAARGQGATEAARFVEAGATVLLVDVDEEALLETAAALGERAIYVRMAVDIGQVVAGIKGKSL